MYVNVVFVTSCLYSAVRLKLIWLENSALRELLLEVVSLAAAACKDLHICRSMAAWAQPRAAVSYFPYTSKMALDIVGQCGFKKVHYCCKLGSLPYTSEVPWVYLAKAMLTLAKRLVEDL